MRNTEGPFVKPNILDRWNPDLIKILQDQFYDAGKSIKDIFALSSSDDGSLDLEGFTFIVKWFATTFSDSEI